MQGILHVSFFQLLFPQQLWPASWSGAASQNPRRERVHSGAWQAAHEICLPPCPMPSNSRKVFNFLYCKADFKIFLSDFRQWRLLVPGLFFWHFYSTELEIFDTLMYTCTKHCVSLLCQMQGSLPCQFHSGVHGVAQAVLLLYSIPGWQLACVPMRRSNVTSVSPSPCYQN